MRTLNLIACLLMFLSFEGFAQNEPQPAGIQSEILSYSDTSLQLITNGRRMLLNKFMESDFEKSREIYHFLQQLSDSSESYLALSPMENVLLGIWVEEYEEVLYYIEQIEKDSETNSPLMPGTQREYIRPAKYYPGHDNMASVLFQRTADSVIYLRHRIESKGMPVQSTEFLRLLIKSLTMNYYDTDTLQAEGQKYLMDYPNSRFDHYVRKYIVHEFYNSNHALGIGIGGGAFTFNKPANDYLNNGAALRLYMDYYYKKLNICLDLSVGTANTAKAILNNNISIAGNTSWNILHVNVGPGIVFHDSKRFKMTWVGSIGVTSLYPPTLTTDDHPEYKEVSFKAGLDYSTALNLDYKLGAKKSREMGPGEYNFPLRLSFRFVKPTSFDFDHTIDGSYFITGLTIGMFGRGGHYIE